MIDAVTSLTAVIDPLRHILAEGVLATPAQSKHNSPSYIPATVAAYASALSGIGIAFLGAIAKGFDARQSSRTDRTIKAFQEAMEKQTEELKQQNENLKQWMRDTGLVERNSAARTRSTDT